jgi:serine/threonine protein kinase
MLQATRRRQYDTGAQAARGGPSRLRNVERSPTGFAHSDLPQIDCLFVVNMRFAFQDDEHCFLVLDLMLGGDLRCKLPSCFLAASRSRGTVSRSAINFSVHLERLGSLPEEAVRIYVAEIATGLAYLHDHKIIHRYVPS